MFDKLEVIDLCQNKPHHVWLWSWHVCHVRWRTSPCLYLRPVLSLCQDQDAGMAAFYQVVLGLARQWCALHAGESVRQQQSQGWPNYRAWRQQRRRARHGLQAELKDRFSWMSSLLRTWRRPGRQGIVHACVRAKVGEAAVGCVGAASPKGPLNGHVILVLGVSTVHFQYQKQSYRLVCTTVFVAIVASILFIVFYLRSLYVCVSDILELVSNNRSVFYHSYGKFLSKNIY